jgi:DNA repair protein RadD
MVLNLKENHLTIKNQYFKPKSYNMKDYKLLPIQEKSLNKIIQFFEVGNWNGLATYPCSFGKSLIVTEIAKAFSDHQIIVCHPNRELTMQNFKKHQIYSDDGAIYSASLKTKDFDRVIFGTIGSFKENFINYCLGSGRPIMVIVDEANIGTAKTGMVGKFITQLGENVKVLGLTATPFLLRGNQTLMQVEAKDNLFEHNIDIVQVQEMIGRWTPIEYRTSTDPLINNIIEKRGLNNINAPITDEEAADYYNTNNLSAKIIIEIAKLKAEGIFNTMVYVPCIDQIKELMAAYPLGGAIYSGMEKNGLNRLKTLNDFLDGKIDVLFNCDILTLGFDFPNLRSIIFARPTNSITLWYQSNGRLVRSIEGKEKAICVDLSGAYDTYGAIEDFIFIETDKKDFVLCNKNRRLSGVPNNEEDVETTDEVKQITPPKPRVQPENKGDMKFNFGKFNGEWIMASYQKKPDLVLPYLRRVPKFNMNWDSSKYRPRLQFITSFVKYIDDMAVYNKKIKYYNGFRKALEQTLIDRELIEEVLFYITKHIETGTPLNAGQVKGYIARESEKLNIKRNGRLITTIEGL